MSIRKAFIRTTWWSFAALIVLELMLRVFDPLGSVYLSDLADYFRPLPLDYVVGYRHQPYSTIKLHGWTLATNADGLRGPELPRQKAPGVLRVLLLGDSVALGWGVPWEHAVAVRLAPLLAAKRGGPVEVVLDATASWNTVFEVRDLYTRFARFDPDLVILLYVSNDFEFRNELGPAEDIGPIFTLIRFRDDNDAYKAVPVTLEWSPPSLERPSSMTSGSWQPLIIPPSPDGSTRRLHILGPPGMSLELTAPQRLKPGTSAEVARHFPPDGHGRRSSDIRLAMLR
jgi:hypothetical protein